ncbi:flagellar assembly peptidoglycan hydrolase FlgJ [Parathalassolituus penaei]|uniref:Peptidoglycan hydrolase FlgJ n=1 Tax=Parathalassolituus penaei TaxID=2997323 RepID=A0A9X3EH52_9GAMM|nr:flagellar assembly peptidoglycan hydrolase FlgJ [Parathalassolituus penaei]MCY0967091.1 flagellar assembly peptidoglycan hydrolase FlgJ [Parathalassolituus penaei]
MLLNPANTSSESRQTLPASANVRAGNAGDAGAVYTDLNSLQSIRQIGKADQSAALMQVSKQFESMFVNMMLTSMRQANEVFSEDSLFDSPEASFYEGMLDNQMALKLSGQGGGRGIGLADVIHRQLLGQYGQGESGDKTSKTIAALDADPTQARLDQSKLWSRRVASPPLRRAMAEVDEVLARQQGAGDTSTSVRNRSALAQNAEVTLTGISTFVVSSTTPGNAVNTPQRLSSANLRVQGTQPAATSAGGKGQQFASPEEFVAALYPHAAAVGEELGVDPRAIVAQAALETGWGKHMIQDAKGNNSFNFFGIKAGSSWDGDSVTVTTHEVRNGVTLKEKAAFRSYDSLEDGLRDYVSFLQNSRYQDAIGQGMGADQYGYALQKAGYATDPHYGEKIRQIARGDLLNQALPDLDAVSVKTTTTPANPFNSADKE